MSRVNLVKEITIQQTARVMQMSGVFDIPPCERSREQWTIDLDLPAQWNVGLIVGPSGSGKTIIARELFGDHLMRDWDWPQDRSILDGFPATLSIKEIVDLLSSVGFSSPPSWLRPFHVLSNGEQFRVNMARALAEMTDLAAVDEFTSVVDRTVAQIGSAAIQKAVRRRGQQFIAVSCHYDIAEWLEPDWIYEPAINHLTIGRLLQRPKIEIEITQTDYATWRLFSKHHYLDHALNRSARCFVATNKNHLVAFCGVLSFPHAIRPGWRISRLVVLPDYQGIGIGIAFLNHIAALFKRTDKPVYITTSHPAFIHSLAKSNQWRMNRNSSRTANAGKTKSISGRIETLANHRLTCGFEFVGAA